MPNGRLYGRGWEAQAEGSPVPGSDDGDPTISRESAVHSGYTGVDFLDAAASWFGDVRLAVPLPWVSD